LYKCVCSYPPTAHFSDTYRKFERLVISESNLRSLNYPRPDPHGVEGRVKLYGDAYGFRRGKYRKLGRISAQSDLKCYGFVHLL